jgi:hypothetical protein
MGKWKHSAEYAKPLFRPTCFQDNITSSQRSRGWADGFIVCPRGIRHNGLAGIKLPVYLLGCMFIEMKFFSNHFVENYGASL